MHKIVGRVVNKKGNVIYYLIEHMNTGHYTVDDLECTRELTKRHLIINATMRGKDIRGRKGCDLNNVMRMDLFSAVRVAREHNKSLKELICDGCDSESSRCV